MKIKILYIIDKMKPAGAQKHLSEVISALDKTRFEPSLITLKELGVQRIYDIFGLRGLWRLIWLMKKTRYDVVHTYLFSENILGVIAARISGIPVVVTGRRDTGMLCQGKKQHNAAYKLTNRWVDKIVCVSKAVQKVVQIQENAPSEKMEIIYNGVDVDKFVHRPSSVRSEAEPPQKGIVYRQDLGIKDNDFVVGMIANFSWIKGHKDLVEAVPLILKEVPNVRFLLIGEGPLEKSLKLQVASLKLEQKVIFMGKRTDIPELLLIMDISVNASYSEGMSNTILESMAAGVPVVATAVDGNLETVLSLKNDCSDYGNDASDMKKDYGDLKQDYGDKEATGILVPPKNPKALASAIIKILKNRDLASNLSQNAQNLIKEKFTSQIMVKNMENLYRELIDKKSQSGK